MTKWIILGIDPGYRNIGLGWVELEKKEKNKFLIKALNSACIRNTSGVNVLYQIRDKLLFAFTRYPIDVIGIEEKSIGREQTKVAEARGVIKATMMEFIEGKNLPPYLPYTRKEVCKILGRTQKELKEKRDWLDEKGKVKISEHEKDALAVAWACAKDMSKELQYYTLIKTLRT